MSSSAIIEQCPSPNHGPRATGKPVDILLIHYTGMTSGARALEWLCNPKSAVSSHYLVFEDGRTVQLVDEGQRAWHAGRASWAGETDINSRSIGIELVHPGHEHGYRGFAAPQIAALINLCAGILSRNPIPPARVLAHSDAAPERKDDPGELFPWQELHAAGIGHWVPPVSEADSVPIDRSDSEAVAAFQSRLATYGYGIAVDGTYAARTEAVVRAFQRHFRPGKVDGLADGSTVATLDALLAALPNAP
ncbi:N-acetylmuramoyl-L-alanine amidase [Bauldia sp.]|uniref:N-acetylmuramoyl-L-alanine amidase n=1 Tax=Bauldia sp. TaxID=2575872 RepID=UPI003BACB426